MTVVNWPKKIRRYPEKTKIKFGNMIAEAQKGTVDHDPLAEIPGAPHGQKRKNGKSKDVDPNKVLADEEKKMTVDRQIRSMEITTKGRVKIGFVELIVYPIRKGEADNRDRKSTRLNSSHGYI